MAITRPYGIPNDRFRDGKIPDDEIICVAFNCANENNLASLRLAASYNNLNDARNPTSGNFFSVSTEQYVSVGENSPTFNRVRGTYTHFIPVALAEAVQGLPTEGG